jgi:hypothetical protein
MNLPNLDEIVLKSLDFFIKNPPPALDLDQFEMPFVVGSVNAFFTGQIIFSGRAAIFANESNFESAVKSYQPIITQKLVTQAVVISASGEKDSVWELELAKKLGLKTTLLTCKPNSTGAKIADQILAYKSIAEPYSYNTSTYMGMILSTTGEKPEEIKKAIDGLTLPKDFGKYQAYSFVLDDKYLNLTSMIITKGEELFGPRLMIRAYTQGYARHAKFINRTDKELVISLGTKNEYFGDPNNRWNIDLPADANFGTVMALSYYICGKIQEVKPAYFKQNIKAWANDYGPKAYGRTQVFDLIVPANQ